MRQRHQWLFHGGYQPVRSEFMPESDHADAPDLCPEADALQAFARGDVVGDAAAAAISAHLLACDSCACVVEQTQPDRFALLLKSRCVSAAVGSDRLRLVGGFEILEELGRGGCGVVYKARQPGTGRLVALKRMKSGTLANRDELLRFRREATALSKLVHPNIVQVFEVGEQAGEPYLAMELIVGEALSARLKDGPLSPRAAAELVRRLALGVASAHEQGIVHRDLKPANVLLANVSETSNQDADPLAAAGLGQPKLVDFGLAKSLAPDGQETTVGVLMGTPAYMAPEQIDGPAGNIGPATDVYGLGTILHECLTCRPPFAGASQLETLSLARTSDVESPRRFNARIPGALEAICLKCLQRDCARRYSSAVDLANDLRCYLSDEPISARPPSLTHRARQSVRRHPVRTIVMISCTAAAIGLFAHQVRLQKEINRANARTQEAEAERKRVVALFLEGHNSLIRRTAEVAELVSDPSPTARVMIDSHLRTTIDYAERLAAAVPGRDTYADLAHVHRVAAVANMSRNDNATVLRHLEAAARAMQEVVNRAPGDDRFAAEAARIDVSRSLAMIEAGNRAIEGTRLFEAARLELDRIHNSDPDNAVYQADIKWVDGYRQHIEMTARNAGLTESGSEVAGSK
jgi:eukaryotic-like serine/threonine-protein kinase